MNDYFAYKLDSGKNNDFASDKSYKVIASISPIKLTAYSDAIVSFSSLPAILSNAY